MKKTDITFVTIVLDGAENIKNYINCVKKGHAEGFKFICIDGDSKDGTKEILKANKQLFDYFISEKDDGFYFALNKAIKRVKTAYYLVFGIDDEIDFKNIQKTLYDIKRYKYELICGSVLLNDSKIKKAKGKFLLSKYLGWGNFISHHSVGTIIATRLHSRYGYYSHHFSLLSDGFFSKNIKSCESKFSKIPITPYKIKPLINPKKYMDKVIKITMKINFLLLPIFL